MKLSKGSIAIFSKSGNEVVLVKPTTVTLGDTIVKCWEVKRVDTGKGMICPTVSLLPLESTIT